MRTFFSLKADVSLMLLCAFVSLVTFGVPEFAFAATTTADNKVVEVMCRVISQLTGDVGKTITIVVLISLAIMLFLGKVSWGVAIAFAVAIGVLFGATSLVTLFAGGGDPCAGISP